MSNKLLVGFAVVVLAVAGAGCNTTETTESNTNLANTTTTRAGADNSEITTTTDASGVKTETRVFRNNPRVSRVVVTTQPSGQRTVRVYSTTNEERVVDNVEDALDATGDALAQAAGWTVKGVTEAGDKLEDVGSEAADKLEDAGDQTKKVGKKAASGAKKTGKAIKDAVTP